METVRSQLIRILLCIVLAVLSSDTVGTALARARCDYDGMSGQSLATSVNDSVPVTLPFSVNPLYPVDYDDLAKGELAADLETPSNVRTEAEYDFDSGCYIIRTKVGDYEIATPFYLTPGQYSDMTMRRSMQSYFNKRNSELKDGKKEKEPFNVLDMNFALGPLEKIFGPGGVQLRTQGSVQLFTGIKVNKSDNPALSLSARRKTYFDFNQKIQATVNASVGERLKFNMNYNTDATFDFDSKNLKLQYEGQEDDIIKSIEAGNVSMTTGSSLIRGSTALFGIKTGMQFGRLTATALVSQQNSESRSINTKGGVQTTKFSINADEYDRNRHYFLAHFFRDNYDRFASKLPYVASGIEITRIEVWVTNKSGNYSQSRNIVGFMDLGENRALANGYWKGNAAYDNPSNSSNNLLHTIKNDYPEARNINTVTQSLAPLAAYGVEGGRDFEKVESARLLQPSEYILNSTLGYISLKTALNDDEVLGVAYEYTYRGQVYQVGEFSADISVSDESLYVKMLKGAVVSTSLPTWQLMMKNIYPLGAYGIQKAHFKLDIKYLSDSTGTGIVYLPVPGLTDKPLLQVMNLDRLDSNGTSVSDGFFDYIEGYTVLSETGRVIFPVVEPFGSHLVSKINNPVVAEKYVYQELYDSTLVVARQFADKNKFILSGEYMAASGSQIRLNAMNVPRGSVVVMAGGVRLVENSDYTVDYTMGIVTITNQSIIDSGQSISVTLENQSLFSTQRKTLLGLDLNYRISENFNIGATIMHFSEKALTEKVNIGSESVNNTMWGVNLSYNTKFMWLTELVNKIPTVNAEQPSTFNVQAEFAQLVPHRQKSGSTRGSSYVDDFESTQTGIDLRSPYAWALASTPYQQGNEALFPEAALSNNVDYGKNRALLAWYYIDRMFTQRHSSLAPGYITSDLKQLSNPYVREVTSTEIFPDRQLGYGESNIIQTLNLSFYPSERGPYNLDAETIDENGMLLNPEKRWGGIMRKIDNTNFEQANIEYVQFWLMSPFLDTDNPNTDGGDLYINFGDISEDILKDGLKSYENGIPMDGDDKFLTETVWGRVSKQNSLTYAFDNNNSSRLVQDVGLDGLKNDEEFSFPSYADYLAKLRTRLPSSTVDRMMRDQFSPFNDPAGDNYHFYRGYDYDEQRLSILERYKHYNGVEGNSLSPTDAPEPLYQSARTSPDVEDINQDNTLNEYERYFQYKISLRPGDMEVGKNFITDRQVSLVRTRDGENRLVEWYQFKIPLSDYERKVGSISDFSSIRFARIFLTGFKEVTHLRFATFELVRGEWRPYDFNLNTRGDAPADGHLDVSVVNIEENSAREPVNYVLPPGVSRITDPGQSQITQLNEQSMSLTVTGLHAGDARAVYRNTSHDLRNYRRLQMWVHAESLIDNPTALKSGELSLFIRLGTDIKNNYYEYEVPLSLTPHISGGNKYLDTPADREKVWPLDNRLDFLLQNLVNLKKERNLAKAKENSTVSFSTLYKGRDPDNERNSMAVLGNPSLSDVRVILIGVRNNSNMIKDGTVWVNELKVTDFDESGGWAAKANVNLGLSDIATFNFGAHMETAGFGGVDQPLNARRLDDYRQYNFALQVDLGRFLPEKMKLRAPIYYSIAKETSSPKYNPLDQDVLLKDALDAAATREERDSIKSYALERSTVESFSISGLRFDVQSSSPKPWDPANFVANFSFNKRRDSNPVTEYENTDDYRGSLQYSWMPYVKGFRPFGWIKSRSSHLKFLKEWTLNYLPVNLSFLTTMSRYYYEQQVRSEVDRTVQLPVSVAKNFLWDRQMNLSWNLTKSLNISFMSNTSARIEEPVGAVNRRLFPDRYKEWRDTVIRSIMHMGTPWAYNQTFVASYRAPFNLIPALNFINGTMSYNATYRWDRGAEIDGLNTGNSIGNMASFNVDGRISLEGLYNKSAYLKKVNRRFASGSRPVERMRAKRFERTYRLNADTSLVIRHNLRNRNVRVSALTLDGKRYPVKTLVKDANTIEVLDHGDANLKFTIIERIKSESSLWEEIGEHAARFAMMVRSINVRVRSSKSLSIPLFNPEIGNAFGQTRSYGPMAPGLDFAFGFVDEDYVTRAKERGWLICEEDRVSPAVWSRTNEFNLEVDLEPIRGLKIKLTNNRTDNHTDRIQFMYDEMPVMRGGSYTKTHCAIATSLRTAKAGNGYRSAAFERFLSNIPVVADRIEKGYAGLRYPTGGFMKDNPNAGRPFAPSVGGVKHYGSDVLIPAFIAAYTGVDASKIYLTPFPALAHMLPNWRVTYDGIVRLGRMSDIFKSFTLTHAYQCTYTVGSFSSFSNWISVDGDRGFVMDELSGEPVPSSPYNISSVSITERFAPLIGLQMTLNNDLRLSAEYRDGRTLTLNSDAGQLVEAQTKNVTFGAGYKIVGFNTILKLRGSGRGISNDLTVNAEFSMQQSHALIRRIETNYTQATSGTRSFSFNLAANYVLNRRVTVGAFVDHRVNTPLVSSSAFPTTDSNYGITLNLNLAR